MLQQKKAVKDAEEEKKRHENELMQKFQAMMDQKSKEEEIARKEIEIQKRKERVQ